MLQPQTTPPRQRQNYDLKAGERSLITGMTGWGKSAFAKFLDRAWFKQWNPEEPERFWPILIYDPDEGWFEGTRFTYAERPELATVESPWNITGTARLHPTARVQIFHPTLPGWQDNRFLHLEEECLERGRLVKHYDELYGLVDEHHIPIEVGKGWTSGRKFEITTHAISQRPAGLPMPIITQSEHKFSFFLEGQRDRERVADIFADKQVEQVLASLPKYWHIYKQVGVPGWVKVGPLPRSEIRE